jgi:hypothetical protein
MANNYYAGAAGAQGAIIITYTSNPAFSAFFALF